MCDDKLGELIAAFKAEVHDPIEDDLDLQDSFEDQDFYSLTLGWAIAKGLTMQESFEFAAYIRYQTDLG